MHPLAHDWYVRHTYRARDWRIEQLVEHKGSTKVSVVLPALNEAATVGLIVKQVVRLRDETRLVDEIIVVDSGSADGTPRVATQAGAEVFRQSDILPSQGTRPGKGEALWKSIFASKGDIIVFVDADLHDFQLHYISGLLGPLLLHPELAMVKGFYCRDAGATASEGGGRVTEILARPVLNALFPLLGGVVQPLAGLQAARRSLLERLPFTAGYGVDVGLLIDAVSADGIGILAQVELGRARHRNQDLRALGQMAAVVFGAILRRAASGMSPWPILTQFRLEGEIPSPVDHSIDALDRPPWLAVAEYRQHRSHAVSQGQLPSWSTARFDGKRATPAHTEGNRVWR